MKSRKALWITAIIFVMAAVLTYSFIARDTFVTKQLFCMDTSVRLTAGKENIDEYERLIKKLDTTLSAYNSTSEISKLNSNCKATVSSLTSEILKKAKTLSKEYPQVDITAGALTKLWNVNGDDPTLPEKNDIQEALKTVGYDNIIINGNDIVLANNAKIDLGSCAKGYALDVLFDEIKKNTEDQAIVSFGSSTLMYGKKQNGKPFLIGIADPDNSNLQVLEFKSGQCFVSTSGGYERFFEINNKRYCHIIDLKTGCPTDSDLTSVTVIAKDNGLLTDFLSTCIFIGGTKSIDKYLNNKSYEIIALSKDKEIYCSDSIKPRIRIKNSDYKFK